MNPLEHCSVVTFPWGKKPPTLDEIIAVTKAAEDMGFYSINLPLVNAIKPRAGGPFADFNNCYSLDALAVLPAMVAATKRIRIAVDAIPVFLLPPFAWAKYFASLDVISNGRVIVGMCLGFGEENFATVGLQQKDRGRIANEQLEVITRLWTEDDVSHQGRYFQLSDVTVDPKPVQKPHPPIWWGGRQKSIPRAARYCEYINTLWPTREECRDEYLPQLEIECAKWDTHTKLASWFYCHATDDRDMDTDEIDRWFGGLMDMEVEVVPSEVTLAGSPGQFADAMNSYREAGMEHFVLEFQRHGLEDYRSSLEQMEIFVNKVVPLLG